MKKNRAFLKWAGGKYPLLDDIKKHLPKGECLIEPFVGAGSVFLNTDFSRYILADINSDLISLYNIVKLRTDEYVEEARKLFTPENNNPDVYYQFRAEFNQSQDPFRRALLFLYLNRHGYNGLCRYNLRGEFNVPFGRYKRPYFPQDELYHFAEKAQNAEFYCLSYEECMELAGVKKAEAEQRARALLELVGLPDKADSYPAQLSGGQQQRVAIARAISTRPPIIMADEPTGALDSKTGHEVLQFLQQLNKEGSTVILITHDNGIAATARRCVRLADGKIVDDRQQEVDWL